MARNPWTEERMATEPDDIQDARQRVTTVDVLEVPDAETAVGMMLTYSSDRFCRTVPYAVIVESWAKRRDNNRRRAAWEAAFTQAERNRLAALYKKFYRWYLVSGVPDTVVLSVASMSLTRRAIEFFANMR